MEVVKEEVKEKIEPEIKDEEVVEQRILHDSVVPKNEFHTEEESLRNEVKGDNFILNKAANKILITKLIPQKKINK